MLDIDTVGTYMMCHEALKYLKKGGSRKDQSNGGLILNISATLHYSAAWYQIHVSAAKVFISILLLRNNHKLPFHPPTPKSPFGGQWKNNVCFHCNLCSTQAGSS